MNWLQHFKLKEKQKRDFWIIFILLLLVITYKSYGYFRSCANDEASLVTRTNLSGINPDFAPLNMSNAAVDSYDRSRGFYYTCYQKCGVCNIISIYSGRDLKEYDMLLSGAVYVAAIALLAYIGSVLLYLRGAKKIESKKASSDEKKEDGKEKK